MGRPMHNSTMIPRSEGAAHWYVVFDHPIGESYSADQPPLSYESEAFIQSQSTFVARSRYQFNPCDFRSDQGRCVEECRK